MLTCTDSDDFRVLQMDLFSEAIAAKAITAGWQKLDRGSTSVLEAHQLFVMSDAVQ